MDTARPFWMRIVVVLACLAGATGAAYAVDIAEFFNGTYVDTDTTVNAVHGGKGEAVNVEEYLEAQGHTLNTFTQTDQFGILAYLNISDILIMPEQELGDYTAALHSTAQGRVWTFVNNGGGFIIIGDGSHDPARGSYARNFLNEVFDYTLGGPVIPQTTYRDATDTSGTAFATCSATLVDAPTTWGFLNAHLPTGAKTMYTDNNASTVFTTTFGSGRICYLGYDFFGTPPSDWEAVLDAAVSYVSFSKSATIKVTTLKDENDGDLKSYAALKKDAGGEGISLREAILAANATVGRNAIYFDVAGDIVLDTPLPSLSDASGGVLIDGGNQIVLDGSQLENDASGLYIRSAENSVKHLAIVSFPGHGMVLDGPDATRNVLLSNMIGARPGSKAEEGNGGSGIFISGGAHENRIGGKARTANTIVASQAGGVTVDGAACYGNAIHANTFQDNTGPAIEQLNEAAAGLPAPTIEGEARIPLDADQNTQRVYGLASAYAQVELYLHEVEGERRFLESVQANGLGAFLSAADLSEYAGQQLSAIAINSAGNTSPFSPAFQLTGSDEAAPEGYGEEQAPQQHSADWHGGADSAIDMEELLRAVQLYEAQVYACSTTSSDDGFMPGLGKQDCNPHSGDYEGGADWKISLPELLRLIQFYNNGAYHACPGCELAGEDGYIAG